MTDRSEVAVPEGGTALFRVKLATLPLSDISVSISKVAGGDADISASPTELVFTPANWDVYQTVTVAAASDADIANGVATIRCAAAGGPATDVIASEADNTPRLLVTDTTTLSVPEGQTASFRVKLSVQPEAEQGDRERGHTGRRRSAALNLPCEPHFHASQLGFLPDRDGIGGRGSGCGQRQATIRCTASGWIAKEVTATEQDNDTLAIATSVSSVSIPEGGNRVVPGEADGPAAGETWS